MKVSKNATSIIEVMVIILILTVGIVGMYKVYGNSQKLANSTKNKIQAIQIAREGIEAVKNIRDTNWLLYGAAYDNCWNVADYNNGLCSGDTGTGTDITDVSPNQGYLTYLNSEGRWELKSETKNALTFTDELYRDRFKVMLDSEGFYTQSGGVDNTIPLFTREIQINYLEIDGTTPGTSNDPKMQVTSLVQWLDNSGPNVKKVEFTTLLSNWKK